MLTKWKCTKTQKEKNLNQIIIRWKVCAAVAESNIIALQKSIKIKFNFTSALLFASLCSAVSTDHGYILGNSLAHNFFCTHTYKSIKSHSLWDQHNISIINRIPYKCYIKKLIYYIVTLHTDLLIVHILAYKRIYNDADPRQFQRTI